ncbi:hypothetical protein [Virgibacillus dokdonensis]|uniref:hypothetical protein n=1 Tax=Virgibacillus dokdonensis TaxID=302167 RepID=UPI00098AD701|nr:hypothetical protein [Virgibacillus dokdonensis]
MGDDKSRSFGNIENNSFGSNINLNGDNVNQINTETNNQITTALEEVESEIAEIPNNDKQFEAKMFYKSLKEHIEKNETSNVRRCLSKLKEIIGSTAGIVTIAKFLGIDIDI